MIILEIPVAPDRPAPYSSNISLTGGDFDVPTVGPLLAEKVILELSDNADDGSILVEDVGGTNETLTIPAGGGLFRTVDDYRFLDNIVIAPMNFMQGTFNVFRGSIYEAYEADLATYIANRDADNRGYNGIRTQLGITSDNGTIDADPLFYQAESYIVGVLPAAALANGGRTYAHRMQVIQALIFLYASYVLQGGGSIGASSTTTRGPVSTETERIGQISKTTSYATGGSSSTTTTVSADDRAEWLEDQALDILRGLGASIDPTSATDVVVVLTPSALEDY